MKPFRFSFGLKKDDSLQKRLNNNSICDNLENNNSSYYIKNNSLISCLDDLKEDIEYIQKKLEVDPDNSFVYYKELYNLIQNNLFAILYFDNNLSDSQYRELLDMYGIDSNIDNNKENNDMVKIKKKIRN